MTWRLLCIGLISVTGLLAAQVAPPERPAGVNDSTIALGKELFHGSAQCNYCHGDGGRGTDRGPSLTGAIWLHGDGSYEAIIRQVLHGVPASQSMSGEPMPIRGWVPMNDDEVRAVAAYVWSISHPPQAPG
jgi:mono/diheme cytochrome c family protein